MITAIEYYTERPDGTRHGIQADKDVRQRNAWHLRSISGNGLAPTGTMGEQTHGLHGSSYHGLTVDAREIGVELYADGYSPAGCQELLDNARHAITTGFDGLGVLRLVNARGQAYRIGAKCVSFEARETRRKVMAVGAVFDCPNPYFEDDVLHVLPVLTMTGGKSWPLERPYTFAEIQTGAQTVTAYNAGDTSAPVTIKLSGTSMRAVTVTNATTGASIVVSGLGGVGGLELCTDPYNTYARLADGTDASRHVSLFSSIAGFSLAPGNNALVIDMDADSLNAAGTQVEWRGRYATCL
jgi:hypothetical protein